MKLAFVLALFPLLALAAPQEPKAVHGNAKVSHPDKNTTVISVSDKAIVEYRHFSIAEGEKVQIKHPSHKSISLHRDIGQIPSEIRGELSSNGKIFLVNPSGIIFGPHSKVSVGSLVASALDIRNSDFISGKYRFTLGEKRGEIVHQGEITAQGSVAFISTVIRNQGVVHAPEGQFHMLAGEAVTVDFDGDGKLSFAVEGSLKSFLLEQLGKVTAQQAMIRVAAADAILKSVVNTDGFVEGTTIVHEQGIVRIAPSTEIKAEIISVDAPLTELAGFLQAKKDVRFEGDVVLAGGDRTFVSALEGSIRFESSLYADQPARDLFLTARNGSVHFEKPIGGLGPLNYLGIIAEALHVSDMHVRDVYALISSDVRFSGHHYHAENQRWIAPAFHIDQAHFEGGPLHFQGGTIHLGGDLSIDTKGEAFSFFALQGTGSQNMRLSTGKAELGEIRSLNGLSAKAEQLYLRGGVDAEALHLDSLVSIFAEEKFPLKGQRGIWCLARNGSLGKREIPLDLQSEGTVFVGGKTLFVDIPTESQLAYIPDYRPPQIFLNGFEIFDWQGPRQVEEEDFTASLAPDLRIETPESPIQTSQVHRRSSPIYYTNK